MVLQDAPVLAKAQLLELCGRSERSGTRVSTQGFSGLGTRSKQSLVLPCILCTQSDVGLHSGCEGAEGGLRKSEKDFRRKYHGSEVTTLIRGQQYQRKEYYGMVQICLGGLAQKYEPIWTAICTREKPSSFFDLQSMLMFEENH